MSLQVWLPLNGDLKNQGLSNYNSASTNYTVINSGKIGKCIKCTDTIDIGVPANGWDFTTTSISFGAWIKINKAELETKTSAVTYSANYASCGGTLLGNHAYGGFGLRWVTNNIQSSGSLTDVHIYANMRNTSSNIVVTSNYTVPFDAWTHVIVIFNREKETLSLYINGTLFQTKSSPIATYGTAGNIRQGNFAICQASWDGGNGNAMAGPWQLNDVRIYDHALSAKEVEEIAKGLVLHYKLDDRFCESTTNLCNNLQTGGRTTLSTNPLMITTTGENADTYWYVKTSSALVGGNTYTLSLQCSGLAPGEYFQFGIGAQSGANNCGYFTIYNGYNEKTFTLASGLDGVKQFILDDSSYSTGVRSKQISFYNVQLEAKNHATGYAGVGGSRGGQYDTNIYIEPDGSKWIRIAHHNNPTVSGYFSSSDPWTTGVYLSEDKWYAVDSAIAQVSTYEFMVKQKTTSSATETKYRWTQNKNPLIAVYNDVKPGMVTFNTSSGYTNSNYGGLWQMNSSARLCIANSSSGNWYGAFGCWTAYSTNKMPGFPNTDISTGYMDLYIRIDNTNLGIIYDSSGYSNNGTIAGSLETVVPSPRYEIATQFPGTTFIKKENFQIGNIWTLSCWFYSPSSSSHTWSPLVILNNTGGDSDSKFSIYYNQSTGIVQFLANGVYDITQSTTKNAWHHLVSVYDGSILYGYIDGIQKTSKSISNTELNKTNLGIGARCTGAGFSSTSTPFEGNLSDVRIYATAFTPEQIKELYNTSMSIDNNGNIHARELIVEDTNNISTNKRGQLLVNTAEEDTAIASFIKPNKIECDNLYEY